MLKYMMRRCLSLFLVLLATGCQHPMSTLITNPIARFNLSQNIQEELMKSEDPLIAQVHVETHQNTAVLSGYVKKIKQSDAAEQIVRQVPGVLAVENNIIIRP